MGGVGVFIMQMGKLRPQEDVEVGGEEQSQGYPDWVSGTAVKDRERSGTDSRPIEADPA